MTDLKSIKELVSTGDVEQALIHLMNLLPESVNKRQSGLLLTKIRGYQQSFNSGLIDFEEYDMRNSRVTRATIDLIHAIENNIDINFKSEGNQNDLNKKVENRGLMAFNGNIVIKGKNVAGRDINYSKSEKSDSDSVKNIEFSYLKRLKNILKYFLF